jgi:AraC family transcriptional regulator
MRVLPKETKITAREAVATAPQPFQWGSMATAQLFASRTWSDGAAFHFQRSGSEVAWVSTRHRVSLQLAPVRNVSIQVDGGRTQDYPALAPLSFTPANIALRTVMPAIAAVAIMQSPETYDDLAAELTNVGRIDIEPLWSIEDPVLDRLARFVQREIDGAFGDDLLMPVLSRAIAVQVARHFVGPEAKLVQTGKLAAGRISRVLDYIDAHLGEELSLYAIADVACLSPFHFTRCFKYTVGSGLHQYVIRRRIQRAKGLIALTGMSLAEIALSVGFDSQAALTTRFTREVGISPGAYRREFVGSRREERASDEQC